MNRLDRLSQPKSPSTHTHVRRAKVVAGRKVGGTKDVATLHCSWGVLGQVVVLGVVS